VALVKSHLVLSLALEDPDVARFNLPKEPADLEELAADINADFSVAPDILRVTMSAKNPEKAVAVVGAITRVYLSEFVDSRNRWRGQRLALLGKLRTDTEQKLLNAEQAQEKIASRGEFKDAGVRAMVLTFLHQQLGMNERELLQTQADLRKASQDLASQNSRLPKLPELPVDGQALDELLDSDRRLEPFVAAEQNARDRLRGAQEVAHDNPEILRRQRQLEEAQRALARERDKLRPEAERKVRAQTRRASLAAVSLLEERVAGLKVNERLATSEVERLRKELQVIPANGAKLDQFRAEVGTLEELKKRIVAEEQALAVEGEAPVSAKVLEQPFIARTKVGNRRLLILAAAGAACALALFGIGWWEHRAQRVAAPEEVSLGVGLYVLGTLPPPPRGAPGAGAAGAGNIVAEPANAVRTLVLSVTRARAARVIMVSSAGPGEGKTSLVCRLATSLGRAGLRTVVVDGDVWNPRAHALFDLPNRAGLSEALRGQAPAGDLIQATSVPGLSLLPAGHFDDAAQRALAQGSARAVFAWLRDRYDIVIVDSSPLLAAAEPLLLGQNVDAVLFSILRGVSRLPSLRLARERLAVLGVPVLGAIVNGVVDEGASYGYSYGTRPKAGRSGREEAANPVPS
jgi:capsular exopolysaccharide synthesis family protein